MRWSQLRLELLRRGLFDRLDGDRFGGYPLPPPLLRYRVDGAVRDGAYFLHIGLNCAQDLRSALKRVRRSLYGFERVLDFGCGCGRVLRWFRDAPDTCRITGVDIDAKAVAWCRRHLPFAEFEAAEASPPLRFRDGSFDLAMAASVLSHLDAPMQDRWLEELRRVCRPKGLVLVSFLGRIGRQILDESARQQVEKEGFLFHKGVEGPFKLDGLPDFYQLAFQTEEDALRRCSAHFKVLEYIEGGLANFEDLAVLEKGV